ncbi:MAG: tryptophan synthase subunit alpha [Spirochaetaceae bacterium]
MSKPANPKLMAHMVAGYPDWERSFEVARALADGGADYIELQFPFSDPSADGPAIQGACSAALEAGFKLKEGFRLLRAIRERIGREVFLMSYASPVFSRGVEQFVGRAAELGVTGVIVPDLPFDHDEGLYAACSSHGVEAVPVVVVTLPEERIERILALDPAYLYASLRRGITGTKTEIGEENIRFLDRFSAAETEVMGGFGISERAQVEALAGHVDTVVVGSAIVRTIAEAAAAEADPYEPVYRKVAELTGRIREVSVEAPQPAPAPRHP